MFDFTALNQGFCVDSIGFGWIFNGFLIDLDGAMGPWTALAALLYNPGGLRLS